MEMSFQRMSMKATPFAFKKKIHVAVINQNDITCRTRSDFFLTNGEQF